jgi:NMD protein affecting ribosome stability and mRNA decay
MTTCPSCGSPLPVDAPAGLCPACLARAARGEARTIDPGIVETMRGALVAHAPELELAS